MQPGEPYVMTPGEILYGAVNGHLDVDPYEGPQLSSRVALEQAILPSLQRPPCGVAFSGGRDSSAVLAVAAHVARREGLPDPIALTHVFPDAPDSDEADWQELVIDHLGIEQWERLFPGDELDLIGPRARPWLERYGVVYPPALHMDQPFLELLGGGSLLTGEGGDGVLGDAFHRIASVADVIRRPWPPRRTRLQTAAWVLAPGPVLLRRIRWQADRTRFPWFTDRGHELYASMVVERFRGHPLSFRASLKQEGRLRSFLLMARNRQLQGDIHEVGVDNPLMAPAVVDALAREGGVLGPGTRTDVLRELVGDLLPDEVLSRTSKAAFDGAWWTDHAREFVASWDGSGLDPDLVDIEALRAEWLSEHPTGITSAMLQAAFVASVGQERPEGP